MGARPKSEQEPEQEPEPVELGSPELEPEPEVAAVRVTRLSAVTPPALPANILPSPPDKAAAADGSGGAGEDADLGAVRAVFSQPAPLGMTFTNADRGAVHAVVVLGIKPGSQAAEAHPEVKEGMVLCSVGGTPLVGWTYLDALALMEAAGRPVELGFAGAAAEEQAVVKEI